MIPVSLHYSTPKLPERQAAGISRPLQQRVEQASSTSWPLEESSDSSTAKLSIRTSPQDTTWLILKDAPSAKAYLEELYRASPEIATLAHLGSEFFRLVHSRDLAPWPQWLEHAKHTALRGFASSLLHDQHAVEAAH